MSDALLGSWIEVGVGSNELADEGQDFHFVNGECDVVGGGGCSHGSGGQVGSGVVAASGAAERAVVEMSLPEGAITPSANPMATFKGVDYRAFTEHFETHGTCALFLLFPRYLTSRLCPCSFHASRRSSAPQECGPGQCSGARRAT